MKGRRTAGLHPNPNSGLAGKEYARDEYLDTFATHAIDTHTEGQLEYSVYLETTVITEVVARIWPAAHPD